MTDDTERSNASTVTFVGEGVDQQGRRFAVFDVHGSRVPVAYEDISDNGKIWSILVARGARLFQGTSRRALLKEVENTDPASSTFLIGSSVGWQFGVFVLPNRIIGTPKQELVLALDHLPQDMISKYREAGTLEEWQQQVIRLCTANTRLMFTACWALASVVAALIPEAIKTGATQIYGPPETGKTKSGMVAGSPWGCGQAHRDEKGFCEDWNTTTEKVEDTISAHSDVGLIFDETNLNKAIVPIAWRLAEGSSKQRKYETATSGYRGFLLSTSNHPLWKLAAESGTEIDDALLSRFLDIPLPKNANGLFEELHGFESGRLLAEAIKVRCQTYYGVAGPAFVERLIADRDADPNKWLEYVRKRREYYLELLERRAEADGLKVSRRTADRMATVYATGRLAKRYGILPWGKKSVLRAVLSCHLDALRKVQPILSAHTTPPISLPTSPRTALIEYLGREMDGFVDLDEQSGDLTDDEFQAAKGFRHTMKGHKWFYITFDRFKRIVGSFARAKSLLVALADEGLAEHNTGNSTAQRRIGRKMRRVVAIRRKILKAKSK